MCFIINIGENRRIMLENDLQANRQIPYGMQTINTNGVPMSGPGGEAIKKSVDNSYLSNRVKQSEENGALVPAATLATWYALSR